MLPLAICCTERAIVAFPPFLVLVAGKVEEDEELDVDDRCVLMSVPNGEARYESHRRRGWVSMDMAAAELVRPIVRARGRRKRGRKDMMRRKRCGFV